MFQVTNISHFKSIFYSQYSRLPTSVQHIQCMCVCVLFLQINSAYIQKHPTCTSINGRAEPGLNKYIYVKRMLLPGEKTDLAQAGRWCESCELWWCHREKGTPAAMQ